MVLQESRHVDRLGDVQADEPASTERLPRRLPWIYPWVEARRPQAVTAVAVCAVEQATVLGVDMVYLSDLERSGGPHADAANVDAGIFPFGTSAWTISPVWTPRTKPGSSSRQGAGEASGLPFSTT
jgi:hypothetical protein